MKSWLEDELRTIEESGLLKSEKVITASQGASVSTTDGEALNFCANNYLGLADDPEVLEAVRKGMSTHGFGMASVRFICGTQDIHKELEQRLTEFMGTEDTILYTSCFDANTGLFETLLGPEDALISDSLNHASIIDGVRLCRAQRKIYQHADMADLEERLKETQDARFRLIATDGVFSMQGDLAPLGEICDLADEYDALVMVDDSHATAFVGPNGRGTPEEMGVIDRVDVVTSTLGKALGGASGGLHRGQEGDRSGAAAALAALSLLQYARAAYSCGRAESVGARAGPPRAARQTLGEHRILPRTHGRAGVRHHPRYASHRACHGQGRAKERRDGGVDEQARHLRRQLQLPGRAEGSGPYQGADIGGSHEGSSSTRY